MEPQNVSHCPVDPDKLLVMVEARPPIYDITSKDHHNVDIINKLWDDIGREMIASAADCRTKWHSLRSSYARYIREVKKMPSGSAAKKRKWHLADATGFLQKHIGPFKNMSSNLHPHNSQAETTEMIGESTNESTSSGVEEVPVQLQFLEENEDFSEIRPKKKQKKSAVDIVAEPMAAYLKSAIQNHKNNDDDPMIYFFKSLMPDVNKLDERRKRQFKANTLKMLSDLIDEQEFSTIMSQPSTSNDIPW